MKKSLLFTGLDVHAQNIAIALAEGGGGEARTYGTIPNDLHALEKVFASVPSSCLGPHLSSKLRFASAPTRRPCPARRERPRLAAATKQELQRQGRAEAGASARGGKWNPQRAPPRAGPTNSSASPARLPSSGLVQPGLLAGFAAKQPSGMDSPRSMRLIMSRETPHLSHSAYMLMPCPSRNSCSDAATARGCARRSREQSGCPMMRAFLFQRSLRITQCYKSLLLRG